MTAPNTRARSQAIQDAARALLVERQINITQRVDIRALAKDFSAAFGCHYDTAKRHLAQAVRLARGEAPRATDWGGQREGAGRPPRP